MKTGDKVSTEEVRMSMAKEMITRVKVTGILTNLHFRNPMLILHTYGKYLQVIGMATGLSRTLGIMDEAVIMEAPMIRRLTTRKGTAKEWDSVKIIGRLINGMMAVVDGGMMNVWKRQDTGTKRKED
jgi:hypothetical protein